MEWDEARYQRSLRICYPERYVHEMNTPVQSVNAPAAQPNPPFVTDRDPGDEIEGHPV